MMKILPLLLAMACATHKDPIDVLGDYLEAEQQGRYASAHAMLSDEDRAARSLDAYVTEHLAAGPLWRAVATRTAFHVDDLDVQGDKAIVKIIAVHPDIRAVADGVPGIPNEVMEQTVDHDTLMYEHIRRHLLEQGYPEASDSLRYELRQETGGWVVWLGLSHMDEAVAAATAAQNARNAGQTEAEVQALQRLLNVPEDAAGAVRHIQGQAQERLAEIAQEKKSPTPPTHAGSTEPDDSEKTEE